MIRYTPIRLAQTALIWERAVPVLIAPFMALGLYLVLAVLGVFERLGDPWRILILLTLLTSAIIIARTRIKGFAWPRQNDAERRVELDSQLKGRPYEALKDKAQIGNDTLWQSHKARMAQTLQQARARRPRAAWAEIDPYGLRVSLILVFLACVFMVGDIARYRIEDAFALRLLQGGVHHVSAEYWIEPPEYTGRPVRYLRSQRTVAIPQGSILSARLTGVSRTPRVRGAKAEFETLSGDVQMIKIQPETSGVIHFRSGAFSDQIDITLIKDLAPVIFIVDEPEGDALGQLNLRFTLDDDYGVDTYHLEYAALSDDDTIIGEFEVEPISPGDVSNPDSEGVQTVRIDLARSALAGERTRIRLVGVDGSGQRGASEPLDLTLPQRIFLDPLAKSIAAERRAFIRVDDEYNPMPEGVSAAVLGGFMGEEPERRIERAPSNVQRLSIALDAVADAPHSYFKDVIVYTGLRTAMHEVRRARERQQLNHMDEDLWQIALRAELGSLADAAEALRAAERALSDAMARGANAMEMSALFDAYQEAVSRYMQALAREAAEAGRFAENDGMSNSLNANMLQELLDALREAAEIGDAEGSRQALQLLTELLANLELNLTQGSANGEGQDSTIEQALREALEELGDAIGEQRSIMEDTFDNARQQQQNQEDRQNSQSQTQDRQDGEPSANGEEPVDESTQNLSDLAQRQKALSEVLDELNSILSDNDNASARDQLNAAQRAMERAQQDLENGAVDPALDNQDDALSALREAAREAAEQLEAARNGQGREGVDPLGRANGDSRPGLNETLPREAEQKRAREILEELRRRAAERGRPKEELDYIDRLLERF